MSKARALRVEKVSVCSPCFTIGSPSSDNCNWLIVCSCCPLEEKIESPLSSWANHFLKKQCRRMGGGSHRPSDDVSLHITSSCFAPVGYAEWRPLVKRSSYGERDYAFGEMMQMLRTSIGLTQAGLADLLGISRRAVAQWEAGSTYPKAEHLKQLIVLGVQQQAFPAGREAEEIRALWHAAHQKLLCDEAWLAALLGRTRPALTLLPPVPLEEPQRGEVSAAEPTPGRRVDWGEALAVPSFYDREREVASLTQWVVQERCRVVSVLGMGGIGKSALATRVMHQLAPHFEVVLWRSIRDAPACEVLLENC